MLLAVEGGFISSSVSGYTKGLAFLLFGIGGEGGRSNRRSEEERRPSKVLPWTHHQYQLVNRRHCCEVQQQTRCIKEEERGNGEEEEEEDGETVQLELAKSNCTKSKQQAGGGCGGRPFLCFGCPTSSSSDFDAHPEHDPSARAVNSNGGGVAGVSGGGGIAIGVDEMGRKVFLKSSMKKPLPSTMGVSGCDVDVRKGDWDNGSSALEIAGGGGGLGVTRKVQWTDGSGMDLTEVKEFEPSEVDESGDEGEGESDRSCGCSIQ